MSLTTIRSPRFRASFSSAERRRSTSGWTRRLRSASAAGSPMTRCAERLPVEHAGRIDEILAEPRGDGPKHRAAGRLRVAHQAVGVDQGGAPGPEELGDGGLAGGDVAGEGDVEHRWGGTP